MGGAGRVGGVGEGDRAEPACPKRIRMNQQVLNCGCECRWLPDPVISQWVGRVLASLRK